MFHNHLWIHSMIDGLAHELVVERLVGYMHSQEIHPKSGNLFDARPRTFVDARDFLDGQVADDVRLAGEQTRHPRGFLFHAFEYHFLDFRLWAPVIVISRQRQISPPLPADKLVRPSTDRIVVRLLAVFVGCRLAYDVASVQPIKQNSAGILGRHHYSEVVHGFHFHVHHVGSLQTSLVILHSIQGKNHVLRCKRRSVVKTDPLPEAEYPFLTLKLPRLSQNPDIFVTSKVHLDQRFDHVEPNANDAAAAVGVGMQGIQTHSLKNDYTILGCRPSLAEKGG